MCDIHISIDYRIPRILYHLTRLSDSIIKRDDAFRCTCRKQPRYFQSKRKIPIIKWYHSSWTSASPGFIGTIGFVMSSNNVNRYWNVYHLYWDVLCTDISLHEDRRLTRKIYSQYAEKAKYKLRHKHYWKKSTKC